MPSPVIRAARRDTVRARCGKAERTKRGKNPHERLSMAPHDKWRGRIGGFMRPMSDPVPAGLLHALYLATLFSFYDC